MDTRDTKRPFNKLAEISIQAIQITDQFWKKRQEINKNISLPLLLEKLEADNHIQNFEVAAGRKKGIHLGDFYFDSDLYKWLEGAFYFSRFELPINLESKIEYIIELIQESQLSDGYLNTFYSTKFLSKRFTNFLIFHELYCAGHLFEAAIAQFQIQKNPSLLKVATQFADVLTKLFLHQKIKDTCGHPEIEMALIQLYRYTKNKNYLKLSNYLIDMRGNIPQFKTYILQNLMDAIQTFNQSNKIKKKFQKTQNIDELTKEEAAEFLEDFTLKDWYIFLKANFSGKMYQLDKPVREAWEPVGHTVRALYLYCGMADLYSETGDSDLLDALKLIWKKMTTARMYITGGVGSVKSYEGFNEDFKLDIEDSYSETCAAIANIMWNWRMFLITANGKYTDLIETLLYNALLVGQSLDGKRYFYSNPLLSYGNEKRQEWFKCPCCPTNYIRFIPTLEKYIYAQSEEGIWINQYIASRADIHLSDTTGLIISQKSQFPWKGKVTILISIPNKTSFSIFLRIPTWTAFKDIEIVINEKEVVDMHPINTYLQIEREWSDEDRIDLHFPMKPHLLRRPQSIKNTQNKVALAYGPLIYCLEQRDNKSIDPLKVTIAKSPLLETNETQKFPGLERSIIIKGRLQSGLIVNAIPYFAWGNRGPTKMSVFHNIEKEK